MGADTVSLDPKYEETFRAHDREFQKFSVEGRIYFVPIDEEEEERQHVEDDVLNGILEGHMFLAEVEPPRKVLDLGYGLALFATAVAEKYPSCEVIGVDIRPLDTFGGPDNLSLECDNLNDNLTDVYPRGEFDVIQSRLVGPGIHKNRWPSYFREIKSLLREGGLFQTAEYYFNIQSHSGQLGRSNALYAWGEKYRAAMETDRDPRVGNKLDEMCRAAGFQLLQVRRVELPIGDWPEDPRLKAIGSRNLDNVDRMLESFALWPFTNRLQMTKEAVLELCAQCRQELRNPALKAYIPLTIVSAKK